MDDMNRVVCTFTRFWLVGIESYDIMCMYVMYGLSRDSFSSSCCLFVVRCTCDAMSHVVVMSFDVVV